MTAPTNGPTPLRSLAGLIGVPAGEVCGPDGCAPAVLPAETEDSAEAGSIPRGGSE